MSAWSFCPLAIVKRSAFSMGASYSAANIADLKYRWGSCTPRNKLHFNWRLIKAGMIDDSDVFAITVNSNNRNHIFASACSGIYESLNGGEQWKKIQGIPSTSRRTRALIQHPSIPGTVYAGTTQGFWMSTNGGKNWSMTTNRNLEINSIAVHPAAPSKVFIGTNNYGVMVSNDGGKSFVPSNTNLTSRLTYAVVTDATQPGRLYATTQNTATSGGFVFYSAE